VARGLHLIVDCQKVERSVCLNDELFLDVMARSVKRSGCTVISQFRYRFGNDSPPGFTAMVMLDESHCSAHTYADAGLIAMDIFTCGDNDPQLALKVIREEIDLGEVSIRLVRRFTTARPG